MERHLFQTDDVPLIQRALEAVFVYRAAQQYVTDMKNLTPEQWNVAVPLRRELKKLQAEQKAQALESENQPSRTRRQRRVRRTPNP